MQTKYRPTVIFPLLLTSLDANGARKGVPVPIAEPLADTMDELDCTPYFNFPSYS